MSQQDFPKQCPVNKADKAKTGYTRFKFCDFLCVFFLTKKEEFTPY